MNAALDLHTHYQPSCMADVMKYHGVRQIDLLNQLKADDLSITRSPARALMLYGIWPIKHDAQALKQSIMRCFKSPLNQEELKVMFQSLDDDSQKPKAFAFATYLSQHGYSQKDACDIVNAAGVKISRSSVNMFLNNGYCPKNLTLADIQKPLTAWATTVFSEQELDIMWQRSEHKQKTTHKPNNNKKAIPTVDSANPLLIFDQLEPEMLSQKSMSVFGLREHPFENEVHSIDDLYMSNNHLRVREAMVQASIRGSILAVVGECGAGKTEIRKGYYDYVSRHHPELVIVEPMVIDKQRLTSAMIFDALADELNITNMPRSLEQRARAVERALKRSVKANNRHVLVIEEAHDLTNAVFKQLKRICELSDGFNRLVSVILVGQPELEGRLQLTNYDIREFSIRCNVQQLPPLGLELENYIEHKFGRQGVDYKKVISPDGITAVQNRLRGQLSYGQAKKAQEKDMSYPLMVNTLLVKAMNLAASMGESLITADVIHEIK